MKNWLRDGLFAAPMLLFFLTMNPTLAVEAKTDSIGQVTSVSQLADVQPTDWAFQAVQSLVERYGCIAGYPDSTYRGNRALTRYEFAAGLNACLDRVNELIATSTAYLTTQEDLEILQRLQEDFSEELAVLRNRVDRLEAQTKKIEAQQFSTTTKLSGEVIFAVAGVTGEKGATGQALQDNTILGTRTRLAFNSSFTGKDQLRVRLNAGNMTTFNGSVTGTEMTRLSFDGQNNNSVVVDELFYRFPLGKNTNVSLIAQGYGSENIAPSLNPLQSDGAGAISRFGRFSPLYRMADGPGVGISHKFGNAVELSAAYRARNASNPATDRGLFGENTSALAQLTFYPTKNASLGLTYVHTYNAGGTGITGDTGSANAIRPFGNVDTATNSYGAVASVRVSPKFTLSGWAGVTQAEARAGANAGSEATVWNWAATLAFPDLGKKGNLGGIIIGMPPKVTSNDITARKDNGTSLHLEALYRYQVNDRIAITPGLIMILNPEHNDNNDTIYTGVVRTTFRF
ncbi:iron uptake porin [Calothrix sp. NIES-3974]|uniref:iron uptake porin n=1 Tax=Calothrix sp. NIES-3974 TaxID=2005462 RepID=UPI000B5F6A73|nr:iron uptake porin [Calothrix sp. NIES-3974]BAZ07498.1 carbohydrate-selective porin OprB [Calothrix sp. NIES-3974]